MTWMLFHYLAVAISGWMDREQQQVIDCLREKNPTDHTRSALLGYGPAPCAVCWATTGVIPR